MSLQIILDNTDVTSYLIEYERTQNLCNGISEGIFGFNSDLLSVKTINTYDVLKVYENGVKKDSLFVSTIELTENGMLVNLECQGITKKMSDYYIKEQYTIDYLSYSRYWIEKFLTEADVPYLFNVTDDGSPLSNNTSLGLESVLDIVTTLVQQSGWYFRSNADGVLEIGKLDLTFESPDLSLPGETSIEEINTSMKDDILRNRVVVWGSANETSDGWIFAESSTHTPYDYDSKDYRTAVLMNGGIYSFEDAYALSTRILKEISTINFIKEIKEIGFVNVHTGQTVYVNSRLYTGWTLVTKVVVNASESGITTTVTLDERCPRLYAFFGYKNNYVYIGTEADGVWKKHFESDGWTDYSTGLGTDLSITDLAINKATFSCVTTQGNLYYKNSMDANWSKLVPTNFHATYNGLEESQTSLYPPDMTYSGILVSGYDFGVSDVSCMATDINRANNKIYSVYTVSGMLTQVSGIWMPPSGVVVSGMESLGIPGLVMPSHDGELPLSGFLMYSGESSYWHSWLVESDGYGYSTTYPITVEGSDDVFAYDVATDNDDVFISCIAKIENNPVAEGISLSKTTMTPQLDSSYPWSGTPDNLVSTELTNLPTYTTDDTTDPNYPGYRSIKLLKDYFGASPIGTEYSYTISHFIITDSLCSYREKLVFFHIVLDKLKVFPESNLSDAITVSLIQTTDDTPLGSWENIYTLKTNNSVFSSLYVNSQTKKFYLYKFNLEYGTYTKIDFGTFDGHNTSNIPDAVSNSEPQIGIKENKFYFGIDYQAGSTTTPSQSGGLVGIVIVDTINNTVDYNTIEEFDYKGADVYCSTMTVIGNEIHFWYLVCEYFGDVYITNYSDYGITKKSIYIQENYGYMSEYLNDLYDVSRFNTGLNNSYNDKRAFYILTPTEFDGKLFYRSWIVSTTPFVVREDAVHMRIVYDPINNELLPESNVGVKKWYWNSDPFEDSVSYDYHNRFHVDFDSNGSMTDIGDPYNPDYAVAFSFYPMIISKSLYPPQKIFVCVDNNTTEYCLRIYSGLSGLFIKKIVISEDGIAKTTDNFSCDGYLVNLDSRDNSLYLYKYNSIYKTNITTGVITTHLFTQNFYPNFSIVNGTMISGLNLLLPYHTGDGNSYQRLYAVNGVARKQTDGTFKFVGSALPQITHIELPQSSPLIVFGGNDYYNYGYLKLYLSNKNMEYIDYNPTEGYTNFEDIPLSTVVSGTIVNSGYVRDARIYYELNGTIFSRQLAFTRDVLSSGIIASGNGSIYTVNLDTTTFPVSDDFTPTIMTNGFSLVSGLPTYLEMTNYNDIPYMFFSTSGIPNGFYQKDKEDLSDIATYFVPQVSGIPNSRVTCIRTDDRI